MKTERCNEMLKIFKDHGIRSNDLTLTLEFQDIIGRSTGVEITEYWNTIDNDQKRIFFWSCSCTLSIETVIFILENTTGKDLEKRIRNNFKNDYDEIEKRWNEVVIKEEEIKDKEIEYIKTKEKFEQLQKILRV